MAHVWVSLVVAALSTTASPAFADAASDEAAIKRPLPELSMPTTSADEPIFSTDAPPPPPFDPSYVPPTPPVPADEIK